MVRGDTLCTRPSPAEREIADRAVHDRLRFTPMPSATRAAIVCGALFSVASISMLALLPLIVKDHLAGAPIGYGALLAAFGMGAFSAGVASSRLRRNASQDRLIALASVACAACCFLLQLATSIPLAAPALAIGGAGWLLTWTGIHVAIQLSSLRSVLGRTLSIYYALSYGGVAAGSWIWGAVAQNHPLTVAFQAAAVVLLLVAAAAFVLPIELCDEAEQEVSEFEPPALALDRQPISGLIVVKIERSIAEHDLDAFLACMRKRRRIQSRAGAGNWTLQRNLLNPAERSETYGRPTWADYLCLNQRFSPADHELAKRLASLHDASGPPGLCGRSSARQPRFAPAADDHTNIPSMRCE